MPYDLCFDCVGFKYIICVPVISLFQKRRRRHRGGVAVVKCLVGDVGYFVWLCWQENNSFTLQGIFVCDPVGYTVLPSWLCFVWLCWQQFHITHGISLCDLFGYSMLPSWLCFVWYVGRRTTVSYYTEYICAWPCWLLCATQLVMLWLCWQQFHTIQGISVCDLVGYFMLSSWLYFVWLCWQENDGFILKRVYLCVTLLITLCYTVGYALCDYVHRRTTVLYCTWYICVCNPVDYSVLPIWFINSLWNLNGLQ